MQVDEHLHHFMHITFICFMYFKVVLVVAVVVIIIIIISSSNTSSSKVIYVNGEILVRLHECAG